MNESLDVGVSIEAFSKELLQYTQKLTTSKELSKPANSGVPRTSRFLKPRPP